jgi:hypothetical protein
MRLDRASIHAIWEETDVPIDIRDTDLARSFVQEGLATGLRWRYGADNRIERVASILARMPAERVDETVTAARSMDELDRALAEGP